MMVVLQWYLKGTLFIAVFTQVIEDINDNHLVLKFILKLKPPSVYITKFCITKHLKSFHNQNCQVYIFKNLN